MKPSAALLLCLVALSCTGRTVEETVVSDAPLTLGHTPAEIRCDPPLKRTRRSASLRLDLADSWHPEPPFDHIVVDDVGKVDIKVTLVTSMGREYHQATLGMAGGLDARFEPELPIGERVVLIRLVSTAKLRVNRMTWHNFEPL